MNSKIIQAAKMVGVYITWVGPDERLFFCFDLFLHCPYELPKNEFYSLYFHLSEFISP